MIGCFLARTFHAVPLCSVPVRRGTDATEDPELLLQQDDDFEEFAKEGASPPTHPPVGPHVYSLCRKRVLGASAARSKTACGGSLVALRPALSGRAPEWDSVEEDKEDTAQWEDNWDDDNLDDDFSEQLR